MTILKDPVRPFDPSMRAPSPRPAEDVLTTMRPRVSRGKTSFELASPGGYLRKVTGSIAYLDEDADTYMVLAGGELIRVPLRDITARHDEPANGES